MMKDTWNDNSIPEDFRRNGRVIQFDTSLQLTWNKADALLVLEWCASVGRGVVGLDVYEDQGGTLVPTYDNWYPTDTTGGPRVSAKEAAAYVSRFPKGDFWFLLDLEES